MNKYRSLTSPNLPDSPVSHVIISSLYPEIIRKLNILNIKTIVTPENTDLPFSLCYHADMQILQTGPGKFICPENLSAYYNKHLSCLFDTEITEISDFGNQYPNDAALNILIAGNTVIGLQKNIEQLDFSYDDPIYVRQGYTRCSAIAINENTIITDDCGISSHAEKNGLNCLLTEKGSVILEGYKEGFIGGCCGMIAPDLLAVAGSLEYHKSGRDIIMFCRKYGVNIAELYDGPLLDIGGIVPAACNNL